MLLGGFAYKLIKGWTPDILETFVEAFGFKPGFYIGSENSPIVTGLDGSLASLLGFCFGVWVAYRYLPSKR